VALSAEEIFEQLPPMSSSAFHWLLSQGVPRAVLAAEVPCLAKVVFHRSQSFFDFVDDGEGIDALILLARDECGEPADLVAWSTRHQELGAYFGAVSVLGADDILAPRLTGEAALLIHRTPLEWLKAGREGVVIINAEDAAVALRDFGPFVARDVEHGKELRRIFRRREPRIFVPDKRAAA
jgi:hypothetical protein